MEPDEEEAARKRKTVLLMAGGALSLLLPLLGVLYLRWSESRSAPRQADAAVFQQREGGERRITPPAAPALPAAVALAQPVQLPPPSAANSSPLPGGPAPVTNAPTGSLGFIKPSGDYYAEKKEEPKPEPPKEAAKPAAAPAEPAKPVASAKTAKAKPGKKPFVMPRLQTGKGFTNMRRPGQQQQPAADEDGPAGMQEMLKDIPGGINNPEVQKYMQQQQGR